MDIEKPGAAPDRDIAKAESIEADLNRFIEHRAMKLRRENQEHAEEQAWRASTRQANEKRREEIRAEWHMHHASQAERLRNTLEDLARYHEEKAQELAPLGSGGDAA